MAIYIILLATDTFISLPTAIEYYNADPTKTCFSVPASEHSVMTSGGIEGEEDVVQVTIHSPYTIY